MSKDAKGPKDPPVTFGHRVLGFFGIHRCKERRLGVRLRFRFFGFAVLALFGSGVGWSWNYTATPGFCRSCHNMEPYYEAWAVSPHKDVPCVKCHYPPGESTSDHLYRKFQALSQVAKFVTDTYSSRPYAEVPDSSCLQSDCHSTQLVHGKLVTEHGIRFDHRPHLEGVRAGRKLRCVSCHSQIMVGTHMEVTYDTCFLCHLKGHQSGRTIEPLGGCTGCHVLPERDFKVGNITYNHGDFLKNSKVPCQSCHQDVIQGDGGVDEERCITCHNQPERIARMKDGILLHDTHVTTHNTACFRCHRPIVHGASEAGTKVLSYDCSVCHVKTHDVQRTLYQGIGARGLAPMPSPMYLANVDCVGCHLQESRETDGVSEMETFLGTEIGCVECHGPDYNGTLTSAHAVMDGTVKALAENLDTIRQGLPADAKDPNEAATLQDISHNLKFLARAHVVHNIYYASQILQDANARLTAIAARRRIKVKDLSELPVISGAFCATLCHDNVGVKVPPETVTYEDKDMPHLLHVEDEGMACTTCHVFGEHKDIRLREPKKCELCHDE